MKGWNERKIGEDKIQCDNGMKSVTNSAQLNERQMGELGFQIQF